MHTPQNEDDTNYAEFKEWMSINTPVEIKQHLQSLNQKHLDKHMAAFPQSPRLQIGGLGCILPHCRPHIERLIQHTRNQPTKASTNMTHEEAYHTQHNPRHDHNHQIDGKNYELARKYIHISLQFPRHA